MVSYKIIGALLLSLLGAGCSGRSLPDPDGGAGLELGADRGPPGDQGGPGTGQMGDRCHKEKPCMAGLFCVTVAGGSGGFCSVSCLKPGQTCSGGPAKTVPVCLLRASDSTYFCAFLCKTATASFPCPGDQTCSPTPNPPGSKQYICVP